MRSSIFQRLAPWRRDGTTRHVHIEPDYRDAVPRHLHNDYDGLIDLPGDLIKDEPRTTIKLVPDWTNPESRVAIKVYRYPGVTRIRTLWIMSKAEREFESLRICGRLGMPSVEPLAWGVARTFTGMVRSCFVITRYANGFESLRDMFNARNWNEKDDKHAFADMFAEMGRCFRRVHAEHFYLLRPAAKDIIVRRTETDGFDWKILDLPASRFFKPRAAARWGQRRDLGILSGSIIKHTGEEMFEPFWTAYLPNPLDVNGAGDTKLRRAVRHRSRAYRNKTFLTRIDKSIKRAIKRRLRSMRSG